MPSTNGTGTNGEDLNDAELHMELTDETYAELAAAEGAVVLGLAFWESSLVDEFEEETPTAEDRAVIDLDLYLDDNTLLELYGASLYPGENAEAVKGIEALEATLIELADNESALSEVAQTEDGGLALIFAAGQDLKLIISASAWAVSEWEELPED